MGRNVMNKTKTTWFSPAENQTEWLICWCCCCCIFPSFSLSFSVWWRGVVVHICYVRPAIQARVQKTMLLQWVVTQFQKQVFRIGYSLLIWGRFDVTWRWMEYIQKAVVEIDDGEKESRPGMISSVTTRGSTVMWEGNGGRSESVP